MAEDKDINFHYSRSEFIKALGHAAKLLDEHKEDINRLNVFPVPDGDTGTNMSLTLQSVIEHVNRLQAGATVADLRKAVTTGALMGARGNSGVITSQILRGFCEGYEHHEHFNTQALASAFSRAEEVAFSAVRKPVEGTILTVLRDSAKASRQAYRKHMPIDEAVHYVSDKAYESVENTPNLLPVLKENGVVDAGGYGLAIFIEGIASSLTGKPGKISEELSQEATDNYKPKVEIEQINDWAGSKFRYCNEFLVDSDVLDVEDTLKFLGSLGDCELCVGAKPKYKVHVHSDHPDQVLNYFLERGQISEVFIHNMQLQSEERVEKLDNDKQPERPHKEIGIVAVAAGKGNGEILESLGVDVVVSGGQTMNPSTKDLADAALSTNADKVIFLPNNKNIILAAKSACDVMDIPAAVIETRNVPSAFTACMFFDAEAGFEDNVEAMQSAFEGVRCGEVTRAIKDSKDADDNPIKEGDTIGICDGEILSVKDDVDDCVMGLLERLEAEDSDMLTILYGQDYSQEKANALAEKIADRYLELEVDIHDGGQPLYPIIFGLE